MINNKKILVYLAIVITCNVVVTMIGKFGVEYQLGMLGTLIFGLFYLIL